MISKQMKELVEQKKAIDPHYNDDVESNWAKMVEVMTANLEWTISYINSASEEEIYFSSEVWDQISEFWRSEELIAAMERAKERFPSIASELEIDISYARTALKK